MTAAKIDLGLSGYDSLFGSEKERQENKLPKIYDIPLSQIDDFPEHPFKVKMDEDMVELVRQELNSLLAMSDEEIDALVKELLDQDTVAAQRKSRKLQLDQASAKLEKNGKLIVKLYEDNSEGRLSDDNLYALLEKLQKDSELLKQQIAELSAETDSDDDREKAYWKFFNLIK